MKAVIQRGKYTDSMSEGIRRRTKRTAANQEIREKDANDDFDKKEQPR